MTGRTDDPLAEMRATEARLADTNELLAEWAACAAEDSAPLIERFERMGYEVRGKPHHDVAEALKHPPTRPATTGQ